MTNMLSCSAAEKITTSLAKLNDSPLYYVQLSEENNFITSATYSELRISVQKNSSYWRSEMAANSGNSKNLWPTFNGVLDDVRPNENGSVSRQIRYCFSGQSRLRSLVH